MRPAELYLFVQGEKVWHFTSADEQVVHAGSTYVPATIGRGAMEAGSDINKANLLVKVPRDSEVGLSHLTFTVDIVTSITLFRPDPTNPTTYMTFWKGRVAGAKVTGSEITLTCESIMTSMRRAGLRARFTRNCRHAVYHRGCGLDPEAFAVPSYATAVSGSVVTVPNAALQPNGWYLGGMLGFGNAVRLITSHAGDQLVISRPIDGLAAAILAAGYGRSYGSFYGGASVKIYPGCDRSESTCNTKFDNLDNNGAFSRIPLKNPFGGSSIV